MVSIQQIKYQKYVLAYTERGYRTRFSKTRTFCGMKIAQLLVFHFQKWKENWKETEGMVRWFGNVCPEEMIHFILLWVLNTNETNLSSTVFNFFRHELIWDAKKRRNKKRAKKKKKKQKENIFRKTNANKCFISSSLDGNTVFWKSSFFFLLFFLVQLYLSLRF